MREINFRGRDEHGEWHYGWLVPTDTGDAWAILYGPMCLEEYQEVIEDTVGQFTGMKDCEGREIYEGDVIKLDNEVYTVSWARYSACWFVDLKNFGPSLFTQYYAGKSIVIGNVHDNPELMEATHD